MPVKVEQINDYLFSDTEQSQKTKSGSDEISQGQYRGKLLNNCLRLAIANRKFTAIYLVAPLTAITINKNNNLLVDPGIWHGPAPS